MKPSLVITLCLGAACFGAVAGAIGVYFWFPINSASQSVVSNASELQSHQIIEFKKAVLNGDLQSIKRLILQDVDLSAEDENGQTPIFIASRENHADIVALLAKNDADVNHRDNRGETPLFVATQNRERNGHKTVLEALIKYGANIDVQNDLGQSVLEVAAQSGFASTVDFLVEKGADINIKDKNGRSAFVLALENGHKEIADSLIGNEHFELNPISPSAKEMTIDMKSMKDRDSVTQKNWKRALKEAVSQNDEDTTEMLLKNYPNFTKGLQDPWPLHSAAEKGYVNIVKTLIEHGVDVGTLDKRGLAAIHCAAAEGKSNVIKVLLDHKEDVNRRDHNKWTSLHWAAWNNREEVVKLLLVSGAKFDLKDSFDRSSMHIALDLGHKNILEVFLNYCGFKEILHWAGHNGYDFMAKTLIEMRSDPVVKRTYKSTPINWAAQNNHTKLVEVLVEKGFDINSRDKFSGLTPLIWSIILNYKVMAKLLIVKGSDVNFRSHDGNTPLYWAVRHGRKELAALLLENNADVNRENLSGELIHLAVRNGDENMIKILIDEQYGADLSRKDSSGKTAIDTAQSMGYLQCAKVLKAELEKRNVSSADH